MDSKIESSKIHFIHARTSLIPQAERQLPHLDFAMTPFTYPLLLACVVTLNAAAHEVSERLDLSLAQRQITVIEKLVDRAGSNSVDAVGGRYRFDCPKFAADLKRMRQGIHNYLSPSRAQPAEMVEMTDDYRAEAPHSSISDEHD